MTVRGKHIILGMLFLGGAVIGGYEMVRRAATPETASLVEDLGGDSGAFDRIYRFGEQRFRLRHAPAAEGAGRGSIVLARLDAAGEAEASIAHPATGTLLAAHFLELEDGAPPTVIAILGGSGTDGAAEAIALRLGGESEGAAPLSPLPSEVARRKIGGDVYERQGAFLYREITLEPASEGQPPVGVRLFYDFGKQAWIVSD